MKNQASTSTSKTLGEKLEFEQINKMLDANVDWSKPVEDFDFNESLFDDVDIDIEGPMVNSPAKNSANIDGEPAGEDGNSASTDPPPPLIISVQQVAMPTQSEPEIGKSYYFLLL